MSDAAAMQGPVKDHTRKVVTEAEILAVPCPTCHASKGMGCRRTDNRSIPLQTALITDALSFHPPRVFDAQQAQLLRNFGRFLGPSEKSLITYYAYVMLCDSVAGKSTELIGKPFNSLEIQKFFAQCAITELRKDGLL